MDDDYLIWINDYFMPIVLKLNIVSLVTAGLVALFIIATRLLRFRAAKRLSYKLYMWITISDVFTHAVGIGSIVGSTSICRVLSVLSNWLNLITVSFTCVLAFNIHAVFIMIRPHLVKTEQLYFVICVLGSAIIMIPTAVLTYLNPDYCDPLTGFETGARLALFWVLSGIWIAVGTLYCFSVFVVVIYKLATHKQMESHGSKLTGRHLKRIVTRLILYPLAPVISLFPYMLTYTISPYVSRESNRVIDVMQLTCLSLQGLINFVFFMADPALPDILSEVRGSVETFSIYGSTTKCSDNEEDKLEIQDLASTSTTLATRPTGPTPQPAQVRRTADPPVRTGAFQSAFPIFGSVSHQTVPERHWVKLV